MFILYEVMFKNTDISKQYFINEEIFACMIQYKTELLLLLIMQLVN